MSVENQTNPFYTADTGAGGTFIQDQTDGSKILYTKRKILTRLQILAKDSALVTCYEMSVYSVV